MNICSREVKQGVQRFVAWQQTAEELRQLYRAESDPALRLRWHALWLLCTGEHTQREVATVLGVHVSTLQTWLDWYRAGGLVEVARHRQGAGGGRATKLTPSQELRFYAVACTGRFRGVEDARQWVEATFGVTYTYDGMRSLLERLEIVSKVPRPQHPKTDLAAQEAFKKGA